MADQTGGAPASETKTSANDLSRFDKFFTYVEDKPPGAQAIVPIADTPAPEEAKPGDVIETAGKPEEKVEEPKVSPLGEKIKADRLAREARAKEQAETVPLKERAEQAEAALAKLRAKDMVSDPVGWADEIGLSAEDRVLLAEQLLYGLAPEKADAEIKIRLMEARHEREKKLAEKKAAEQKAEADKAEAIRVQQDYVAALEVAAMSAPEGSYPDTEAWYGDDHQSYMRALYATSYNMAEAAREANKVADLSFEAVAKVLEQEIATRYNRRKRAAAPEQPKQEPKVETPKVETKQVSMEGLSTKGLGGAGSPRPPAKTEAERMARAAEVLYRTK